MKKWAYRALWTVLGCAVFAVMMYLAVLVNQYAN